MSNNHKSEALLSQDLLKKLMIIVIGSIVAAYGITLALYAGFGGATLAVLWQGIAKTFHLSIGMASFIVALERAMVLGKLGEQTVLMSEKAFDSIEFMDSIAAPKEIYFPKKLARDTTAREDSQKEKGRGSLLTEKYILDIIREGWQNDDQLLQRIVLR